MTDSFEARGDFLPEADTVFATDFAENFNDNTAPFNAVPDFSGTPEGAESSLDAVALEPNGFVKLGLAKELLQAVADMGFTQPTAVQMATIPKAMQALDDASENNKAEKKATGLKRVSHVFFSIKSPARAHPADG